MNLSPLTYTSWPTSDKSNLFIGLRKNASLVIGKWRMTQNHMFTGISVFFTKQSMSVGITTPPCRNRGPYSGVKLTLKKSCNNYTNDK